jgi:hypothetical protein
MGTVTYLRPATNPYIDSGSIALNRLQMACNEVKLARSSGDEVQELLAYMELDAAWQDFNKEIGK